MRWTVLVPVRVDQQPKSRLIPATTSPALHARLVEAIRADTLTAAQAAPSAARVLIVDGPGLNAALSAAARSAAHDWPGDGVAALVGDLPALRPAELDHALAAAASVGRGFVADSSGTGTTLLTAAPGLSLTPSFGAGSAARHQAFAVLLPAGPGLRADVDTAADLAAAVELGVGPATRELVSPGVHPDPA